MVESEIITEKQLATLERNTDYFFEGGVYEKFLLTNPTFAHIYITNDNKVIAVAKNLRVIRIVNTSDIKRVIASGTVTLALGFRNKSFSLVLWRTGRRKFKYKSIDPVDVEAATGAFLYGLDRKGVKTPNYNIALFDVIIGLLITATLCMGYYLKGWVPLIIILLLAIDVIRNNFF